jgi:hypothetical protein
MLSIMFLNPMDNKISRAILIFILFSSIQSCASVAVTPSSSVMKDSGQKVSIGMTEKQVLKILGRPQEVNAWENDNLLYEGETAWHYEKFLLRPSRVVYFKNGLVTQVEEFFK